MTHGLRQDYYRRSVQLYADYASAVDSGRLGPVARVLHRRRALIACSRARTTSAAFRWPRCRSRARGCCKDRVYGIRETLFHDPYYQRHVVGAPLSCDRREADRIESEANYAVFRTKLYELSTVFNVGRYIDVGRARRRTV